jgi:hypothetical protein
MGQIIAGLLIACLLYPFERAAELLAGAAAWIRRVTGTN